jgi:hypothetical protein
MSESNQTECARIGHQEIDGLVTVSDFRIVRQGRSYVIEVAIPDYISEVKARNEGFRDSGVRTDEKIFPMDVISGDEDEVCSQLAQIPTEELIPFLTEQI